MQTISAMLKSLTCSMFLFIVNRCLKNVNVLFVFVFGISATAVEAQSVKWTVEARQATDPGTSQDPTSVTTYKGSIYFIYVDTARNMVVAKKSGSRIERFTVFKLEMGPEERWHICPSIAVDKNGFIHITGDMHNGSWKYFKSAKPENIYAWKRRNDLPFSDVTYPSFFYSNKRELFICFRHRRNGKGHTNHRGGVIRYNAEKDTFIPLGGTSYNDFSYATDHKVTPVIPATTKTMVWGNGYGGHGSWYVKPGIKLYFDKSDRMHLVASLINEPLNDPFGHQSNTHIIYAYSDDFGTTWHQAGGKLISSLPLTVTNASVVVARSAQHDIYGGYTEIGAFAPDKPVVTYRLSSDESTHSFMYSEGKWVEVKVPHPTNVIVSRDNGYVAWFDGTYIDYTKDGKHWISLSGKPSFPHAGVGLAFPGAFGPMGGIDAEYFKQTGNLRYHGKLNDFAESSIVTIFSKIK